MTEEIIHQIGITAGVLVFYFITRFFITRFNKRYAVRNKIQKDRAILISKIINFILSLLFAVGIAIIWNFTFENFFVYLTSFFTILGIGLFAQWSILSNVTSALILFFYYPYRIGSKVKIIDGDNSITGIVRDITLFSVKIEDEDGHIISYPNNLAIQKPMASIEPKE
ncbi:mechanosensitive ion channel domain-containing protein [Reichenbachiella sp. MALMAid0571]|uniref:mechanosensitive ion channel domain-containing protein n=1 Tax=Reichenbachiella sp. MALMAid0571 TaxID=3143939 RepID=UPI0032DE83F6